MSYFRLLWCQGQKWRSFGQGHGDKAQGHRPKGMFTKVKKPKIPVFSLVWENEAKSQGKAKSLVKINIFIDDWEACK